MTSGLESPRATFMEELDVKYDTSECASVWGWVVWAQGSAAAACQWSPPLCVILATGWWPWVLGGPSKRGWPRPSAVADNTEAWPTQGGRSTVLLDGAAACVGMRGGGANILLASTPLELSPLPSPGTW